MNYLVDYKTKYLKYKNKYLQLKNLNGGAKCPNIGHHQHLGECWHDSYTMIMLYSDDIGNYLQHIFDLHQFANIDHLIKDLFSFGYENMPDYLLPFNIYKGNYRDRQMFEQTATSYIKNLYERYINEKREGIPKERELFDPKKIYRQDSTVPSLTCTLDIYQIANYGNIKPSPFTIKKHGGNVYQLYFMKTTVTNKNLKDVDKGRNILLFLEKIWQSKNKYDSHFDEKIKDITLLLSYLSNSNIQQFITELYFTRRKNNRKTNRKTKSSFWVG